MVGSISDPDDRIATDLGSKSTTDNRITTGVISATSPDLIIIVGIAKLSETRWIVYYWELPEKSEFNFLFKICAQMVHFIS